MHTHSSSFHWSYYKATLTSVVAFNLLEQEMATYSSVLAWRIPGMAEPGGLPSMESHRVGHDCSDLAAAAAKLRSLFYVAETCHLHRGQGTYLCICSEYFWIQHC